MKTYRLRIAEVVDETEQARTLVLDVPDEHREVFAHRAGQFVTVRVPLEDGSSLARSYSFSSPEGFERPRITVKRMGIGSGRVCALSPGEELEVLAPGGEFTPEDLDTDLVLCAAGSGITPVHSILRTALERGRGRVFLVYANASAADAIFGAELTELAERNERFELVHWYESERGLPNSAEFAEILAPHHGKPLFYCGPDGFMAVLGETVRRLDWPREQVHVEEYVSLTDNPFEHPETTDDGDDAGATLRVNLDGVDHELAWPRQRKMLDVMLENGLDAPYSCREGKCSTCACRMVDGDVKLLNNEVLEQEDLDEGIVLACQSLPLTDEVSIRYD